MFSMTSLAGNKEKEKEGRISQIYDIINTVSTSANMRDLLEVALNKILRSLSSERGSIFLTGDDGQELFLKWAYNIDPTAKEIKKRIGEGIIGKVAMEKKGLLVRDIREDSRFNVSSMFHDYKTNSFLCVPIATDVKLIGVINITENKSKKAYSEEDLRFLEIVAGSIARKIEKSQLSSELDALKRKSENEGKMIDLGKFASGISHELNSPLDGIIRYINLTLGSVEEGVVREYLLEAKSGLNRIVNIVKSLLQLVKHNRPVPSKLIDVNHAIDDCIEILTYESLRKDIDITKELYKDLPRIRDLGIQSIFSNILKNAIDAVEEKGSIKVSTSMEEGFIKVSISDTGCGILQDNVDRIFEPFFTTKETTKGSGLGLAICYDIVKRYNGKIDVSSEPGKETKFTICIPC
ncbi:ATP-binding protein [Candidatus Omnitrophota bacterium]